MSYKKRWFFAIVFVLVAVPAAVFPEEFKGRSPVLQISARHTDEFRLPSGEAEKQLAGNARALAALKHAQAVKLRREYLHNGDMKKLYTALNTAGEAIRLDPSRSTYWADLGSIHSELARFNVFSAHEYAQDSFRQAIDLAPDDAASMVLLAVSLARTGEYEEALDYFEKAVTTNILMLSADIARWMNVCYLTDAQTARGAVFYENLQKKNPEYRYLNLYKAVLYRAHFDNERAIGELKQLLERNDADRATKETAQKLLLEISREGGKN